MPLGPGTRLGPYEIQSALGAGGMGEVYKAKDTRLDRIVAIKVLPAHVSDDPALRERFEREARAVAALNHPHICTLHDVGHQDGTDFLVMEYLDGETLAAKLTKGALPIDQALAISIQIADALDKAHRAGIVHRDLKPGNIMLTKSGAKLVDFGLAKVTPAVVAASGLSVAPTGMTPVTMQGTILGTLQYMAPEQIEGQEADTRTDIFAFGCVLYEMLTSRKAFEGKTQASLISAILKDSPPAVSVLQPLAPRSIDRVTRKCLAKDPDARWQTAHDLVDELRWINDAADESDRRVASAPTGAPSRLPWFVAATFVVAAAVLVWPALLYWRSPAAPSVVTQLDINVPAGTDSFSLALSPDARQLAFVAPGERGPQVWVRPLDATAAKPLPGTEGASYPFWSPDGRSIGFFAESKLKRIDLSGGAAQPLADAPVGRGGTWNRDGVIVFDPAGTSGVLMQIPATGGAPTAVTTVTSGGAGHMWPRFLPDGRHFLFFYSAGTAQSAGVYVGALDGGTPVQVLAAAESAAEYASGYLLVVSRGDLIARRFDPERLTVGASPMALANDVAIEAAWRRGAFSVSNTGTLVHRAGSSQRRQLAWFDRTGKTQGTLVRSDDMAMGYPQLSPDGKTVSLTRNVDANADSWLVDVTRGVVSRLTYDRAADVGGIWSPDSSRTVFRSARNGKWELFDKPADGSAEEHLFLASRGDVSPLDWSLDGKFLLYAEQSATTASDLWLLPLTGDRKPIPVVQTRFDEVHGTFSPDGRWIAYTSNETGRYEVYVRPFQGGGRWQISAGGGVYPRWRHDGRELFYITLDDRLMAASIEPAADGRSLASATPLALFQTRLVIGGNAGIGGFASATQYAVSADGRFLMLVSEEDATASPARVVLNWDAGLKK